MEVLNNIKSVHNLIVKLKKTGKTIGFVPTMGALHQGHISLVEQSLKENNFTLVSVFINPKQINNYEDLNKYKISTDNYFINNYKFTIESNYLLIITVILHTIFTIALYVL